MLKTKSNPLLMSRAFAVFFCFLFLSTAVQGADVQVTCTGSNDTLVLANALATVRDGGTLTVDDGAVCRYDQQLVLAGFPSAPCSGVVIEGGGSTWLTDDDEAADGGLLIQNCHDFEVRNLTLDGNRAQRDDDPDLTEHLLLVRRSSRGTFRNVSAVNGTASGFFLKGFTIASNGVDEDTREIRLIGCTADNNFNDGLTLVDATDVQVLGGRYANSSGLLNEGVAVAAGIRLETHDDSEVIEQVVVNAASIEGNAGAGIHVAQNGGGESRNIRLLGNDLAANDRAAFHLRGSEISILGNHIHDFNHAENSRATVFVQAAAAAGTPPSQSILIADNQFANIETGLDVISIQAGVEGVEITDNAFRDVNVSSDADADCDVYPNDRCSVIANDSHGTLIAGNRIINSRQRGVFSRGQRTMVLGNVFDAMARNVIFVNGEDSQVQGNTVGPLAIGDATGTADESVVRSKKGGGIVSTNSVACLDKVQRGFYFDTGPVLALGNIVDQCKDHDPGSADGWARFPAGATTVQSANVQYP